MEIFPIMLIIVQVTSAQGICRFGYDSWCAFQCYCTTSCDQETGQCLNGGQCVTEASGVRKSGDGCLTGNVAYYKDAYQIGTWGPHVASRAVDGNTNPDLNAGHCAHPDSGVSNTPAWWYVDLGKNHRIYSVTLYNRVSDDGLSLESMADFSIRVGNSVDVTQNPSCATFSGPVGQGESVTLTCETTGRYVGFLRVNNARKDKHLAALCEVVVIGHIMIECNDCPTNCHDEIGCEKCQNGTRLPDCSRGCYDALWGENCEQRCPSACLSGTVCDKETGNCNGGCGTYEKSNPWRFGDKCDVELPSMSFGAEDNIHTPPTATATSVTWEWTESGADGITAVTARYVGYYLWYRKSRESTWSKTPGILYKYGSARQQGIVYNLEPDTRYEFDISVYRTYDGKIYEDSYRAASVTYMDATTDSTNSVTPIPIITTTTTEQIPVPTTTTPSTIKSTPVRPKQEGTTSDSYGKSPNSNGISESETPQPSTQPNPLLPAVIALSIISVISVSGIIILLVWMRRKRIIFSRDKSEDPSTDLQNKTTGVKTDSHTASLYERPETQNTTKQYGNLTTDGQQMYAHLQHIESPYEDIRP